MGSQLKTQHWYSKEMSYETLESILFCRLLVSRMLMWYSRIVSAIAFKVKFYMRVFILKKIPVAHNYNSYTLHIT